MSEPVNTLGVALIGLLLQGVPQQPGTASIEGVVVLLGTRDPIAGARVQLSRAEDDLTDRSVETRNTTSAADGSFVFENLPADDYRLVATFTGSGYTPAEYGQRHPRVRGTVFPLTNGQRITGVELAMGPTGSISGRLFDAEGDPVGNARVMALETIYRGGQRSLSIVQAVRSNDLGEYRLFWLPAGRYYIGVLPVDLRGPTFAIHIVSPEGAGPREDATSPNVTRRLTEDGEIVEEADVIVYYGGGRDASRALPVDLTAGGNIGAIDVPLHDAKVRSYHVRGQVIDAVTGLPVDEASVWLIPSNPSPHALIANDASDEEGGFDIAGAMPGSYFLFAAKGASRGGGASETFLDIGTASSGRLSLGVGNNDVDNVTVAIRPSFSVDGRVIVDGVSGTELPDLTQVRFTLRRQPDILGMPTAIPRIDRSGGLPSGAVAVDGTFVFKGFGPGDYRIETTSLPENAYVESLQLGFADVSNGFSVEGPPDERFNVVVRLDGGAVRGTTSNQRGETVGNATVVLVPAEALRRQSHLYRAESSDAFGRFEIRGIAPGQYKLFAWEVVEPEAWQDPEFIRIYESSGMTVRVERTVSEELQVTAVPPGR